MKDKPLIVKLVVGVVGFFIVITLIGLTMETPTPPPTAQKASPVQKTYKSFLINEKVHDAPVKTQIEQFYVITGKPTKGQMEAFLKETYETLRARTGFKHHNNPTAIYIWLYESRAHYESGMGQHFARLSKSASDATYSIEVNDNLMPTPKKSETKPVVKKDTNPGLSESEKKQIYLDAVRCEDKAVKESGRNDSRTVEEIERTNAIREKLDAECKIALAKNLDITIEQIKEISIEGVAENWPFPEQE